MSSIRRMMALALGATLLWSCASGERTPSPEGTPAGSGSRASRDKAAKDRETVAVELSSLWTEVPEYGGKGRNLFAFGAAERGSALAQPPSPPPQTAPAVQPERRASQPPPSARVELKFAGFIEKTRPGGDKVKYAVFLDGREVLTGAEGELVANRYKIVQIGLESVTISVAGSSASQKIPLQSN